MLTFLFLHQKKCNLVLITHSAIIFGMKYVFLSVFVVALELLEL